MTSAGPKLLRTRRFEDDRGWFSETYSTQRFAAMSIADPFVQDNQSCSVRAGTLRGIHFQLPPHGQGKLVRCVRGAIMDYAIDLRRGSPTYGGHVAAELSAHNGDQLWIPIGFGHAFITLEAGTEVTYKVTALYARDSEAGIVWNCPALAIDWPIPANGVILSDKDKALPTLASFESPFEYDGVPLSPLAA